MSAQLQRWLVECEREVHEAEARRARVALAIAYVNEGEPLLAVAELEELAEGMHGSGFDRHRFEAIKAALS